MTPEQEIATLTWLYSQRHEEKAWGAHLYQEMSASTGVPLGKIYKWEQELGLMPAAPDDDACFEKIKKRMAVLEFGPPVVYIRCDSCGRYQTYSDEGDASWRTGTSDEGAVHTCPTCQTSDTGSTGSTPLRCRGECGEMAPSGFAMCHACTEGARIANHKALGFWRSEAEKLQKDNLKQGQRITQLEQRLREVRMVAKEGE